MFMRPTSLGQPLRAFPWLNFPSVSFGLVFFMHTSFDLQQAEGENFKKMLLPIWKQSSYSNELPERYFYKVKPQKILFT